jgi:16S rRNA (cytosine1402-N4)-methyltransferase
MEQVSHRPVLLREALEALGCRPGGLWIDGTVGSGGHAEAILRATAPDGRLLACDRDDAAIALTRRRLGPFGERVHLRHLDHRQLPALLDQLGWGPADGILLDLGISSAQLDDDRRGFSFQGEGPLDMRMDRTQPMTAADLINALPESELATILKRYGEEPAARRIARHIARERARDEIRTTRRLAEIVSRAAGPGRLRRIHPATRTFQALRIAVNGELDGLDRNLESLAERLREGGRLAVISFHSLEDRIVKRTFAALSGRCVCPRDLPVCACGRPALVKPLNTRLVRPGSEELADNPRSRSARLRAAERSARGRA